MKKSKLTLWIIPIAIVLVACGGNEYETVIESAIDHHRDVTMYLDETRESYEVRENANVVVYDEGKYITLSFIDPEDETEGRKETYEKVGDSWTQLEQYQSEMLLRKSPSYQEQLGKEM
ncbi:cystatin-like fold lipoprotein [Alkalicoccobacillus gibsonii]|uniref:Cystatin-like fold lipoprotein n=1 Tax=Alkalicoccobacillus gibsonii TaxID=79881 RepID=A0ABU9VGG8_9BACI